MGEVEPKERYFWGTYKYGTKDNLTKYNGSDNKITIDPEDDAVVERYAKKGVALNNLCTGCAYCKDCPKGIAIPKFMDAYNQKILTGNDEAIIARMNNHWGIDIAAAKECLACGKCEKSCTQHLPIIERLQEIVALGAK